MDPSSLSSVSLMRENDELKEKLTSACEEIEQLKSCNDRTQKLLTDTTNHMKRITGMTGKQGQPSSGDYSDRHMRRVKRQRLESCCASLGWLEAEGYTPLKVELKNKRTGEVETVALNSDVLGEDASAMSQDDLDMLHMMLYIKDKFNVSGEAYHRMARLCKAMPRHYKLKQRIAELNRQWNFTSTPNGTCGLQQSLEEHLRVRIQHLHKTASPDAPFCTNKMLRVKLSGDGTNIGKHLHVINVTFSLLDEGARAYSVEGNHALATVKESEDYASLRDSLQDISKEVKRLTTIEVDGVKYNIKYYLGGDWKFLVIVTGIDSARSEFACIWCKCGKDERHDMSKCWSITDPSHGARSIDENITLSQARKKSYNVSHAPLFPSIPLSSVVIDNLHMFLRVSDVLIMRLIDELKRQDAIDSARKFSNFNVTKFKYLQAYEQFVAGLGIPGYHFYTGKNSKVLKICSLTGPEKLKVFSHIQIEQLLPGFKNNEKIQSLWEELLALNRIFSKRPEDITDMDITSYEARAKVWVGNFVEIYHSHFVTPYIHAMACHVGEFMRIHGSILPFTQQGMEKLNDMFTKVYFRGTNHREAALKQVMEKQNRLEYLRDLNAQPPKHHEVTCSICGTEGHNKLTCSHSVTL